MTVLLATCLALLGVSWLVPPAITADILEVCGAGCAHRTIAAALAQAQPGDVVWVRAGTYREAGPVRLRPGVTLRGEDPQHPERTIIESDEGHAVIGTGRVLTTTSILEGFTIVGGSGRGMYIQDGAAEIVRNNVFRNCVTSYMGAAIRIDDEGTSPTITDNTFIGNSSALDGGAIYIEDSSPLIRGNRFILNQSYRDGGAIAIRTISRPGQQATIDENEFSQNAASAKGGAIYIEVSKPIVQKNRVVSNTAHAGAGIYVNGPNARGTALIQQNWFEANATVGAGAESVGGALAIFAGADCQVDGNVIKQNLARRGDGVYAKQASPSISNNVLASNGTCEIWVEDSSPPILNNTIVGSHANGSTGIELRGLSYPQVVNNIIMNEAYGVRGDWTAAPDILTNDFWGNLQDHIAVIADGSNLHADPLLSDAPNDDFHLQPASPMIDAGNPLHAPPIDFDGHTRPVDGNNDGLAMPDPGADEYLPPATLTATASPSPSPTSTSTQTHTQSPTHSATGTATPTPTSTSTVTSTPTSTPRAHHVYLPLLWKP